MKLGLFAHKETGDLRLLEIVRGKYHITGSLIKVTLPAWFIKIWIKQHKYIGEL